MSNIAELYKLASRLLGGNLVDGEMTIIHSGTLIYI